MGSIDRIVNPPKNIILRMWVGAGLIIAAVFFFVLWDERFRESCETDEVFFAVLGAEQGGKIRESFSGNNFSVRMAKMGLALAPAHGEAMKKVAEVLYDDEERADAVANVPFIWIYADGRTTEAKDLGFETLGKAFFSPEKFAFSVADESGFSVQISPQLMTIFRAQTGDAIGALPVLRRPSNAGKFRLLIDARNKNGEWSRIGDIAFDCRLDATFISPEPLPDTPLPEKLAEEFNTLPLIEPESKILSVTEPHSSRAYSSSLDKRELFGELALEIGRLPEVPLYAWHLENVYLESENEAFPQQFLWEEPDAFHSNVRFLEDETFNFLKGNCLRVPIAKTLFPKSGEKWRVTATLVRRMAFRPEEIHRFPALKMSKNPSVVRFGGTYVRVRAFLDEKYSRLIANNVPALVVEIAGAADLSRPGALFWQPYRVKTDCGEEMLPESTVVVRPGVYQYWFMPMRRPKSVEITYAITRATVVSGEVIPEIRMPVAEEMP